MFAALELYFFSSRVSCSKAYKRIRVCEQPSPLSTNISKFNSTLQHLSPFGILLPAQRRCAHRIRQFPYPRRANPQQTIPSQYCLRTYDGIRTHNCKISSIPSNFPLQNSQQPRFPSIFEEHQTRIKRSWHYLRTILPRTWS